MPAKRRGKAVLIPSSPAFSFASSRPTRTPGGGGPGPGSYDVHSGLDLVESRKTALRQARLAHEGKPPRRAHTADESRKLRIRHTVLQDAGHLSQAGLRSSPCVLMASKPFPSGLLDKSPGPGTYEANVRCINQAAPAFTFRGVDNRASVSTFPGPGTYKLPDLATTRPSSSPVALKFRCKVPAAAGRTPAPNAYTIPNPAQLYKGVYAKATIKLRHPPGFVESLPTPGPQDYDPQQHRLRGPAYTLRPKCDRASQQDSNPGPGHYDVDESTIGNWGAGMGAGQRPAADDFLSQRIDVFAKTCGTPLQSDKLQRAARERRERVRSSSSIVVREGGVPRGVRAPRTAPSDRTSHALERLYVNDA